MRTNVRISWILAAVSLLVISFGITACGDKPAEQTTATATSVGKPDANSTPQQPSEQGKAASSGSGNQMRKPLAPPP